MRLAGNTALLGVATTFAAWAHRDQVRKGSDTPYIAHPMAVSALVIAHGGDLEQAIAALLHDTVEDCGVSFAEIAQNFGERPAGIVQACTDGVPDDMGGKPPWRPRKEAYLAALPGKRSDAMLVILCDKVHNAESIAMDLTTGDPDEVFGRFTGGAGGTAWYYMQLAEVFSDVPNAFAPQALVERLSEAAVIIDTFATGSRFGQAKEA